MDPYNYDHLSSQDNDFLRWEKPGLPMHLAGLQIFKAGPLLNEYGGVDFEKIREMVIGLLHRVPRCREKLEWVIEGRNAVWVDDEYFNPDYHIRHTSLPRPGTRESLKELFGNIMAQPLDRSKPLWELWVIEGLEGERFATVLKAHHCMMDGAAGVDFASRLLARTPDVEVLKAPPYFPRPLPTRLELLSDEAKRRVYQPLQTAVDFKRFVQNTADLGVDLNRRARAVSEVLGLKVNPASETPINGPVGPHRSFEGVRMSLERAKGIRSALNCSINDVVLTVVTGAVREYMRDHQVSPAGLDFRVEAPVNVRREVDEGKPGNHVSSWVVRLPLAEKDPLRQLASIHRSTEELRETKQAAVVELLHGFLDWISFDIQLVAKGMVNMVVTNVVGPQAPLYMLGAELEEAYPVAPLLENLGLGVGMFSYNGSLFWGLMADSDRIPDLAHFADLIQSSFDQLESAATHERARKKTKKELALEKAKKVRSQSKSLSRPKRPTPIGPSGKHPVASP
jgi:diacylglycerol O-acyltransferase